MVIVDLVKFSITKSIINTVKEMRNPAYGTRQDRDDINLPFQHLTATLQSGHFMSIFQPFCVQFQPDYRTSGLTENFYQLTTTMNYDHLFGPLRQQEQHAVGCGQRGRDGLHGDGQQ